MKNQFTETSLGILPLAFSLLAVIVGVPSVAQGIDQNGSGFQTLGQTGSGGVHTMGQTGSGGVQTFGQTGSGGVHTMGQTGSGGVHTLGQTGSG
jgi:hypothetical protein